MFNASILRKQALAMVVLITLIAGFFLYCYLPLYTVSLHMYIRYNIIISCSYDYEWLSIKYKIIIQHDKPLYLLLFIGFNIMYLNWFGFLYNARKFFFDFSSSHV